MVQVKSKVRSKREDPPSVEPAYFLMFRLKGTVFYAIWWQVLFLVLYTTGIIFIEFDVPQLYMNFPDTLIDILGVVTGLLLCFRTDSAFNRYQEGRELWSKMTICVRSMTRGIWLDVREETARDIIEKKSALNLLVAFVVATKHYLREEYSYEFHDLQELINHLPKLMTPSSVAPLKDQKRQLRAIDKYSAYDLIVPTNIPIEVTYYIADYLKSITRRQLIDEDIVGTLEDDLEGLVECLSSFERIQRTPIPLAYSVHLHHSVWIYLLSLPYQMVAKLGWFTIPCVGLAAFSMLGILAIGWEIENPFGYDKNDLPLDDFCEVIRREIDVITATRIVSPEEWIYSDKNRPLAPNNSQTAAELVENNTLDQLHELIFEVGMSESIEVENFVKKTYRKKNRNNLHEEEETLIKLVKKEHRGPQN